MFELLETISANTPALAAILTVVATVLSSGLVTTVLTQLTKLPFIPVAAKSYPRVTSIVLAIITAGLATWLLNVVIVVDWITFALFAGVTAVVSWKIYDAARAVVDEIRGIQHENSNK